MSRPNKSKLATSLMMEALPDGIEKRAEATEEAEIIPPAQRERKKSSAVIEGEVIPPADSYREKRRKKYEDEKKAQEIRDSIVDATKKPDPKAKQKIEWGQDNPFYHEQPRWSLFDRASEGVLIGMEKAYKKTEHFLRPVLKFQENPDWAIKRLDRYENLVQDGKATFMGEMKAPVEGKNKRPDYSFYRKQKEMYRKKGNFKGHYFRMQAVYDKDGKFTGKIRLYRFEK